MDRMILKIARQLNSYDEASLLNLWYEYASSVQEFEPTKEWEEKALALCLVQAVAWKNQLFNYNLAATHQPSGADSLPFFMPQFNKKPEEESSKEKEKSATILKFPSK